MSKIILRGGKAREAIKRGVDEVGDSIKVTLGPKGRNAIMQRYNTPLITNDGVTIAREIEVDDPIEQLGVDLMKEVANKANDVAGDGTTTAIVLAQSLIGLGMAKATEDTNVMEMRLGMEETKDLIMGRLKGMARPVGTLEEAIQVASISAESEDLGKVIGEVVMEVGKDGAITVEESPIAGVFSEIVTGMKLERGYLSHYLVTDTEKMVAEYANVAILITDKSLRSVKDILPFLEKVINGGKKELLIIAEDMEGEALATIIVNKVRGIMNVAAIKAPGFGDRKKAILEDIAIATGGKVVTRDAGLDLSLVLPDEVLGFANKVVVTKDTTIIVTGNLDNSKVAERIASLRTEITTIESKHDQEQTKARIAMLNGVVAVIKVGANTESEAKYLKLKVDDAVNATQAAVAEGIVVGGGCALVKAVEGLQSVPGLSGALSKSYADGVEIVLEACLAPFIMIALNAGCSDPASMRDQIKEGNRGYNAKTDNIVDDMFAEGVIDPVKVTRTSLERAVSAAAILLTTEVAIAEVKQDEEAQRS